MFLANLPLVYKGCWEGPSADPERRSQYSPVSWPEPGAPEATRMFTAIAAAEVCSLTFTVYFTPTSVVYSCPKYSENVLPRHVRLPR